MLGPNGAGKTTLFNLIAGAVRPDSGRVAFEGEDISALDAAARCRRGLARSFQVPHPFGGMSVFENVLVGAAFGRNPRDPEARALAVLEQTGMRAKANQLAGGLTLLDRKRLELARALATDPKLLLLDEIAGGLTDKRMCVPARRDPRRPCGGRDDCLDRACRACAAVGGAPPRRHEFRPDHRGRAPGRSDGERQGEERLSGRGRAWVEPLLRIENLQAFYDDARALQDVGFTLARGETLALIGANGAGKSTLLKSICGLLASKTGRIIFAGADISRSPAAEVVKLGVALVPEGRRLFPSLSVEENLTLGGQVGRKGPWSLGALYDLFPILKDKRRQPSTSLSGGQQQMVAIGRALMSNPDLLMLDELSLGLAPVVIKDIYELLPQITGRGLTAILVEQDVFARARLRQSVPVFARRPRLAGGPAARTFARGDHARIFWNLTDGMGQRRRAGGAGWRSLCAVRGGAGR